MTIEENIQKIEARIAELTYTKNELMKIVNRDVVHTSEQYID